MPVLAAIAIAALLGGGTSFAAQNALPGDPLYAVKVDVNEKVGGLFQLTPQAQASWQAHLAETRLNEAQKLATEGKLSTSTAAKLQADFDDHANNAETKIEALQNASTAITIAGNFEHNLKKDAELLALLGASASTTTSSTASSTVTVKVPFGLVNAAYHHLLKLHDRWATSSLDFSAPTPSTNTASGTYLWDWRLRLPTGSDNDENGNASTSVNTTTGAMRDDGDKGPKHESRVQINASGTVNLPPLNVQDSESASGTLEL